MCPTCYYEMNKYLEATYKFEMPLGKEYFASFFMYYPYYIKNQGKVWDLSQDVSDDIFSKNWHTYSELHTDVQESLNTL